jgi:hypothetical protein
VHDSGACPRADMTAMHKIHRERWRNIGFGINRVNLKAWSKGLTYLRHPALRAD